MSRLDPTPAESVLLAACLSIAGLWTAAGIAAGTARRVAHWAAETLEGALA